MPLKLSINTQQYLQTYSSVVVEFVKIILSVLLMVFIPQACPDDPPLTTTHECTMKENFTDLISINVFALTWNFLTLFCFFVNLVLECKRENYIISNYDYSKTKSVKSIQSEVFDILPEMKDNYLSITKRLFYVNYACLLMMSLNVLFSAVVIYHYYYDGFKSITAFITNVFLIVQKVNRNNGTLKKSIDKVYVQSTIRFSPYYYNILDVEKYKTRETSV